VKKTVEDNPFFSLRKIADKVSSTKDTVRRILKENLGLKKRYCKWVPHELSDKQKYDRVVIGKAMLTILNKEGMSNFTHLITGDESWMLYNYPFRTFYGKPSDPVPEIVSSSIQTPKPMLVVFWAVSSTPVLSFLPPGQNMNSAIFKTLVVDELLKLSASGEQSEHLIVHWDNARSHSAGMIKKSIEGSNLVILPQPPYSPDLAPSDFFLFGYMKNQLRGKKSENTTELLIQISDVMKAITLETRLRVMKDWIWRIQSVIASGGEYY
jgi:transposase